MYNNETKPIPSQQRTNGTTKGKAWRWDTSSSLSHTAALNEKMVVGV